MKGPRELLENEDRFVTRMGAWFPGERTVFRGKDLHRDLAGKDWMWLYVYGITGRDYGEAQIALLHAIWVYTSYPDPRLWNNRVAALAGTARSTSALGMSAALAISEASIYGRRPDIRTMDFLRRLKAELDGGQSLPDVVNRELERFRGIAGYGRPLVATDERIEHLMKRAETLGLSIGPYVSMVFEVEKYLQAARRRLRMNYAALAAAFCADLEFSPREFYMFTFLAFVAGMVPCYLDTAQNPEGGFLPLRCTRVEYEGPGRVPWD